MHKLREHLATAYFSVDVRSLALFRIVFACVLLVDLCLRWQVLDMFYTNAGLLPNHTLLWAPPARHMFSFFFTASRHGEVVLFMLLCAGAFVALLIGYRTKLAQVASLLALVSLNTRLAVLENGGDMVMNLLAIWTVFLPLGRRFSVDAVRTSLRARPEQDARALADRSALRDPQARVYSLAVFALLLQFFFVYYFNVVHKTGPTWQDGTAVHYTLHQDRLVTSFGVFLRETLSPQIMQALTWGAVVIEAVGALMIISPFFLPYTRAIAACLMPLLHLGFQLCLDLGVFSYGMMAFFTLLLVPVHWDWITTRAARWHRRRRVFFDASCGVCFALARLVARLDVFERLEIIANTDTHELPAGVTPELVEGTLVVTDEAGGRAHTRAGAVAAVLRSLPLGFLLSVPLQLPGLHALANIAYDRFARRRAEISVWLGYAACGLPQAAPGTLQPTHAPFRQTIRRYARAAANVALAILMLAVCGEIVNSNAAVPRALRYPQPAFMRAVIDYPRLLQGWRMFAPHAPLEDFMIEVDAVTRDGRHVDPYNQITSRVPGPGYTEIPDRLGQGQFYTGYSLFIWSPRFRPYLTAFKEWILRHHERTGRPQDRIVRFTASVLSDKSPPPGQTRSTDFKREVFLRHPDTSR